MELDFNPEFEHAINLMKERRQNLFITGKAGTGKSTLLNYFCQQSEEKPVVLAPTGVAALNVKGQTIHRFFNFYIDVTPEKILTKKRKPRDAQLYKKLKTIIIDEVSMLRADLLDCIDAFLSIYGPQRSQSFGGVHMIFVGDLYQLPPVAGNKEREIFRTHYPSPYFFEAKALESISLEIIELEKVYRQKDKKFVEMLNKIRNNSATAADLQVWNTRYSASQESIEKENFTIHLTTTNTQADKINEDHLKNLQGRLYVREAAVDGEFSKEYHPTLVKLQFKLGAQIMLLNNDQKQRWVNGSIGVIEALKHDADGEEYLSVRLQDSNILIAVYPYTWELYKFFVKENALVSEPVGNFIQYPLRLAWAVTIHKSQGQTFEKVMVDVGKGAFTSGQTYVALSRCTTFEGIYLKTAIRKQDIRVDYRVHNFLTSHAYKKAEEKISLAKRLTIIEQAIANNKKLELSYLKADGSKSERLLIPTELGEKEYKGHKFTCMSGYCMLRQTQRTFNVARILDLKEV